MLECFLYRNKLKEKDKSNVILMGIRKLQIKMQ